MNNLTIKLESNTSGQWSKLFINGVFLGVFRRKAGGWEYEPVFGTCTINWDKRVDAENEVINRYKAAQ